MRTKTTLRNLIVLTIMFLVIYELVDSFRNDNLLGIALSLGSVVAFIVIVRLARKMSRVNANPEEEEQKPTE